MAEETMYIINVKEVEGIGYYSEPIYDSCPDLPKKRRKAPCFSYGDIRRSWQCPIYFLIFAEIATPHI